MLYCKAVVLHIFTLFSAAYSVQQTKEKQVVEVKVMQHTGFLFFYFMIIHLFSLQTPSCSCLCRSWCLMQHVLGNNRLTGQSQGRTQTDRCIHTRAGFRFSALLPGGGCWNVRRASWCPVIVLWHTPQPFYLVSVTWFGVSDGVRIRCHTHCMALWKSFYQVQSSIWSRDRHLSPALRECKSPDTLYNRRPSSALTVWHKFIRPGLHESPPSHLQQAGLKTLNCETCKRDMLRA